MRSTTRVASTSRFVAALFSLAALVAAPAGAVPVFVPDNGGGTANVPILADYIGQSPMQIVNGLPFGSTIDIVAVLNAPDVYAELPNVNIGGHKAGGGGTGVGVFDWQMQGTGAFLGYSRTLTFPPLTPAQSILSYSDPAFNAAGAYIELRPAPRTPYAPFQSFDNDVFRLFGRMPAGDPDFDLLRVTAGSDFGLPSPGHTNLLQAGSNWLVDSFFDVTYRIDFVGNNTGPFAGMSGSTTATVRFSLGDPIVPEPSSCVLAGAGMIAMAAFLQRRR